MGSKWMRRLGLVAIAGAVGHGAIGCAQERDPINRVQSSALSKHFFVGDDLSPAEKWRALDTWEQDARQMLTASNEGMAGDQEGLDQRDSDRLGEVLRAKEKIAAKPKQKHSR